MTAAIQRAYVWPTHYLTKFPSDGGTVFPIFKLENDGGADASDVTFSATVHPMTPESARAASYSADPDTSCGTLKAGAIIQLPREPLGDISAAEALAIMAGTKWLVMDGAVAWTDQFGKRVTYRWLSYTTVSGGQWASDILRDETEIDEDLLPVAQPAPIEAHKFPASLDERMSDYAEVEEALSTDDLLASARENPMATEQTVQRLDRMKRKKFFELLNVELAELQQERGGPRENLQRESEIESLLGLFARVGEM